MFMAAAKAQGGPESNTRAEWGQLLFRAAAQKATRRSEK
jgi:hypothetical protein